MSFNLLAADPSESNIRLDASLEPLGALGDIGWYTIRGILYATQYDVPLTVSASATFYDRTTKQFTNTAEHGSSVKGVIIDCSAVLSFPDGVTGTFNVSFAAPYRNAVDITGSKGRVYVADFVSPAAPNESTFLFAHKPLSIQQAASSSTANGKQNSQQVEPPKPQPPSVNELQTHVTIKHRDSQVTSLMRNASRMIRARKEELKSSTKAQAAAIHENPPVASAHNFDSDKVVIDSDNDAQLSILQEYERNLIDYPHLALLTQAVSDAVNESALNGGKLVNVEYKGEPSIGQKIVKKLKTAVS
jgi:predicted dehydrogenase